MEPDVNQYKIADVIEHEQIRERYVGEDKIGLLLSPTTAIGGNADVVVQGLRNNPCITWITSLLGEPGIDPVKFKTKGINQRQFGILMREIVELPELKYLTIANSKHLKFYCDSAIAPINYGEHIAALLRKNVLEFLDIECSTVSNPKKFFAPIVAAMRDNTSLKYLGLRPENFAGNYVYGALADIINMRGHNGLRISLYGDKKVDKRNTLLDVNMLDPYFIRLVIAITKPENVNTVIVCGAVVQQNSKDVHDLAVSLQKFGSMKIFLHMQHGNIVNGLGCGFKISTEEELYEEVLTPNARECWRLLRKAQCSARTRNPNRVYRGVEITEEHDDEEIANVAASSSSSSNRSKPGQ